MKQVQAETGGRPFANDDLVVLQQELTAAVQAQFLGKGPFILSGCTVTGTSVSAGIVCLDGQLLRFAGQAGVSLPAQFQAGTTVLSDPRPYQTGGTKNCMREVPAVLVASNPAYSAGEFLPIDTWGGKTWADVQRASVRSIGEVQQLASVTAANYDSTGLGKPGTEAWGWGLCNGQGGRADLRGRFIVGHDPATTDYGLAQTGGAAAVTLDASQLPSHSHTMDNRIVKENQGDAGTFTAALTGSFNSTGRAMTMQPAGGGKPFDNRPPYYSLAMRQWVGL